MTKKCICGNDVFPNGPDICASCAVARSADCLKGAHSSCLGTIYLAYSAEDGPCLCTCHGEQVTHKEEVMQEADMVNHPPHYRANGVEVIDVIEAFGLGYHLGNCIKYVLRAGRKGKETYIEDLKKARWYIDRQITLEDSSND